VNPARTALRSRTAVLALAAVGALGLPACADNPEQPETGTDLPDIRGEEDLADPYDGPYDAEFHQDVEAYADQEVTLSADVAEVLSDRSFTITGPEGEEVEPILVVTEDAVEGLEQGGSVLVAATAHDEFELADVEEELGVDLTDEEYEEWDGEPYLTASQVETQDG
jgi:hypothetical protein